MVMRSPCAGAALDPLMKPKVASKAIPLETLACVCYITAGPITKLFAWGGEESGGHVL